MDTRRPPQQGIRSNNGDNRFHYPQSNRLPRSAAGDSTTSSQASNHFPPHPSVRVPANVKTAARQVPAGVGVAPRPLKQVNNTQPYPRPQNNGMMVQDYKFPQAPPPIPTTLQPQRSRDQMSRKYNMHDSYVSSIYEDSPIPRTTPSTKSPGRGHPLVRDSASVYPETEFSDSPQAAYPSSRLIPQQSFPPSPIPESEAAYPSSKTTPYINTTDLDPPKKVRPGEISPASSRTTAMNALSAAIAAGFSSAPKVQTPTTPPSRTFSPMRMPFADGSRPRSVDEQSQDEEIAPPELIDPPAGKAQILTPGSAKSFHSTNPLLGLGISNKPGMSSKVPVTKRPARLDIDAVRDMEARGSTTSLTDLIKRATKLASNLDRGKTASRLGMLDAFGSKEKLGGYPGNRDSTMSDMLSSFPAPAAGGTPRRDTMWPLGDKDEYMEKDGQVRNAKPKRRCCGISIPVAIVVMIVVVMLIAAAVLIPVFLILVPKQSKTSSGPALSSCLETNRCKNGGTSIVANQACQCICSNGFTGSDCSVAGGNTDCTTSTVSDGSNKYRNATMGQLIQPIFSEATTQFNIPLNASLVLATFASTELSCQQEDSLVTFNVTTSPETKRFVIVPGLDTEPHYQPDLINIPTHTTNTLITPTPHMLPRQDQTVGSSNGIVFQASTEAEPTTAAPASTLTSLSDSPSATASTSAAPSSSTTPIFSDTQQKFAQVAVLYVLQLSSTPAFAANAQMSMNLYFAGSTNKNGTVSIGTEALPLTANFKTFEITSGDGNVVGGKKGS